jgi:peptidoglycan hydrolase-like protein with peptidoglycan-binding domain
MLLRPGDFGPEVRALQHGLNKLGSILLLDGDFGPATRDAVIDARSVLGRPGPPEADDALQAALAAQPDPFPPLTAGGVTFIAREEVSGPRQYRQLYRNPIWPSAESGITIGIGYDLRFATSAQFHADWADRLPPAAVAALADVLGQPGSLARLDHVRDVEVPLLDAVSVFLRRTLPLYLDRTRSIYPEVDTLAEARRTALVSVVYNRGTRLTDTDPLREERREMRAIQSLLAAGHLDGVAEQIDAMARLWDPERLPGLVRRRHNEARLWRSGFPALQLA